MEENLDKEKEFLGLSSLDLSPYYIDDFIEYFSNLELNSSRINNFNTQKDLQNKKKEKEDLTFCYATMEDAKLITEIIKDAFEKYPFHEMIDVDNVRNLIKNQNSCVFLFKNKNDQVVGTISFDISLKEKKGYVRSLAIYKKYRGMYNIKKINILVYLHVYKKYKNDILVWYGESFLSGSTSQYITNICSLRPIGFLPNKDIFKDNVVSEFLQIAYFKKALKEVRSKKKPKIIIEVLKSFIYASIKYDLTWVDCVEPKLKIERRKILENIKKINIKEEINQYGYKKIKMTIKDSDSFFLFLYTPHLNNITNVEFKINQIEELSVFLHKFNLYIKENNVRYCECYVSAYDPIQQRIFTFYQFNPRGYIPSWKYNQELENFEDCVLFNKNFGAIQDNFEGLKEFDLVLSHFSEKEKKL
ncbi:MAG: hypothetical protein JXA99_00565 [Candidatus Lokiarchaeota archaeon]|nr:hypothetical protein [Candidatus Lokiarchaeota archaeon]